MVVHFVILSIGFMQFANFTGVDIHREIKKDSGKQGVWLVTQYTMMHCNTI